MQTGGDHYQSSQNSLKIQPTAYTYHQYKTTDSSTAHSPVQFCSGLYLCSQKSPYALHPISQTFPHTHIMKQQVSYPPAPGFLPTGTMSPIHLHSVSYPPAPGFLPTCTRFRTHQHNVSYPPAVFPNHIQGSYPPAQCILPTCTRFPTHLHLPTPLHNVSYPPAPGILPTCTRSPTHLHKSPPHLHNISTSTMYSTHLHQVSYPPAPGLLPTCTISPPHLHNVSYPPAQCILPTCTMSPELFCQALK